MFFIERLSKSLASKISEQGQLDEERKQIIAYGAFCFMQTAWGVLVVVIFGAIFNVLLESLVLSIVISILRKYSGGAHSSSPNVCALVGAIIASCFAIIIKKYYIFFDLKGALFLGVICFVYSYYILKKLAPVDSPSKPIVKQEKKQAFKRKSMVILYTMYFISALLLILNLKYNMDFIIKYVICIYIGVFWQSFTLTSTAHVLLRKVDKVFENII